MQENRLCEHERFLGKCILVGFKEKEWIKYLIFANAYSMSRIPPWPSADFNGVYSIGHGEFISFGKNMDNIMLTVYNN